MCVVDGRGGYQKSDNYCPKLDVPDSKVECVKGSDRFDCLRKLRKNMADFSVFTPEDLIAAVNTENDVLITNELRISLSDPYEEQIVAVVSKSSGITNTHDLKEKILCHPGYESNGFISEVLTNFLESTVVRPQKCDISRTVPENRILSSSAFFKSACKPGPWMNDPDTDRELKQKYENLCRACNTPQVCSKDDKYYGSSGSLLCLKDGTGDISWTTYKQVRLQFDLDNKNNSDEWTDYNFLCRDNTMRPLNSTNPCPWVAQPWSVVAANRKYAVEIQKIVSNATHTPGSWQAALLDLLEIIGYHVDVYTLDGTQAVDSYLSLIPGYLNANSFTGCPQPRTVRVCTTSIPSQYKCGWMREAAAVHGLEPDIDCLKADNATHCMEAIQRNVADVVIVHPDYINIAKREYNLKTLFYEAVNDDGKYLTVPVINRISKIETFADLKGKRACFPMYDGVAWNTVIHELSERKLISTCPYEEAVANFFGDSCVPDIPQNYSKLRKLCPPNVVRDDVGALDCVKNGVADVAFVSENSLRSYILDKSNSKFDFRVLCEHEPCYQSWSPPAQAMVSHNTTSWRDKDVLDVFFEIDNLFGTKFKGATRMFAMYGEFDGKHNVLFNDNTVRLQKTPRLRNYDKMPREYEELLTKIKPCIEVEYSSSTQFVPSRLALYISLLYSILRINKPNNLPTKSKESRTSSTVPNKRQVSDRSTGSRVQKVQYFPNTKQMYTNVVKAAQQSPKESKDNRERHKTRTLTQSEIRVLKSDSECSSLENFVSRPQTATIKKAPQPNPDDYEDDFDSYESDFEEYTSSPAESETISEASSTEEDIPIKANTEIDGEHKLDSGNFDLPETRYTQVLDSIGENETKPSFNEPNRSNLTSLSDEGFEDGKIDKSGQFINFLEAQRKQNQLKSLTVKRQRGEELAGMIKLDAQIFMIFEMESIPYHQYIKKFGNNNTLQTATQTGHDNISVETQTIERIYTNKWTQYPIKLQQIKKNDIDLEIYKQEALGIGTDTVMNSIYTETNKIQYNEHSLKYFVKSASDVILNLIEEKSQQKNCKDIEVNSKKIPFSDGYITFNTKLPHLENVPVICANFGNNTTKLITIHSSKRCSFLCVWKISDPNNPEYCIKIHVTVTCSVLLGLYIYSGINDGSIAVWDLQDQNMQSFENIIPPSYITNINTGHVAKIISIEVVDADENCTNDDACNCQVYSLDEDGYFIVWTVIVLQTITKKQISLQKSLQCCFKQLYPHLPNLQCTNMAVHHLDINHIFISTNYGQILHVVSTTGTKANPSKYTAGWTVQSNCITPCPFSPLYVLSAYENGKMALFSRHIETPLITLTNCDDDSNENGIEFVEWSKNKPCVLYAKDKKNCIHIWDLSQSDIFPVCTVPFKDEINFMKLSPNASKDETVKRSYMVLISNKFNVNLYILNKDHGQQNPTDYDANVKKFLNYVNRL
ncbi:hypothetical protein Trydic_g23613 [Trypoxylus dichotomus]